MHTSRKQFKKKSVSETKHDRIIAGDESAINQELKRIRDNCKNPDSKMNVAALHIFSTPDGELHYVSAGNTEFTKMPNGNMCAERNALRYIRSQYGHDFVIEKTYVSGGDKDEKLDTESPKHVSCCGPCRDEIQQFADFDKSTVHLIPANDGSKAQEIIALKHMKISTLGDLIPPILRYNSEKAYESERRFRANGILTDNKNEKESSLAAIQDASDRLVPNTDIQLNGDITKYVKAMAKKSGNSEPTLTQFQNLLAVMRSRAYLELTTEGNLEPKEIGRIDVAIIGAGDRFYAAVSCGGTDSISQQQTAILKALDRSSSFISKSSDNRVHTVHLMGEALVNPKMQSKEDAPVDRLYPFLPELYKLAKQSTFMPGESFKVPDMDLYCYAPTRPLQSANLDLRKVDQKLSASPKKDTVSAYKLFELDPQVFISAKLRRAGIKIENENRSSGRG